VTGGDAGEDKEEAWALLGGPLRVGEKVEGEGEDTESFAGAMTMLSPGDLEVGPRLFGHRVLPERQDWQMS